MQLLENLSGNERAALHALKGFVESRFGLRSFMLFGSRARGESPHGSDIDVMITLPDTNADIQDAIDERVVSLNIEYDVLISTVLFSEKELDSGPMRESPLFRVIAREGVSV